MPHPSQRAGALTRPSRPAPRLASASAQLDQAVANGAAVRDRASSLRRESLVTRMGSRPDSQYAWVHGQVGSSVVTALVRRDGSVDGDLALVRRAQGDDAPGERSPRLAEDPLAATLRLARACDVVFSVELADVGRRSPTRRPERERALSMQHGQGPATDSELSIAVEDDGDLHTVRLFGELDVAVAPRVREVICEVAGSTVVVDLTQLSFIDAFGIQTLLTAKQRAEEDGHTVVIRGAQGIVRRVFEVTDLSDLLEN